MDKGNGYSNRGQGFSPFQQDNKYAATSNSIPLKSMLNDHNTDKSNQKNIIMEKERIQHIISNNDILINNHSMNLEYRDSNKPSRGDRIHYNRERVNNTQIDKSH